jgi:hypothetical protein
MVISSYIRVLYVPDIHVLSSRGIIFQGPERESIVLFWLHDGVHPDERKVIRKRKKQDIFFDRIFMIVIDNRHRTGKSIHLPVSIVLIYKSHYCITDMVGSESPGGNVLSAFYKIRNIHINFSNKGTSINYIMDVPIM